MKRFSEAIQSKILLFDGSMGALLSRMGHVTPCPDELAVTRPDVIRSVHQGYLDAGADVLLSDTFGATEMTLAHKKRAGMGEKITAAAVRLAREVAGSRALVAVDMGPTSAFLYPTGEAMPADFYKTFFDQARCAKENGADFAMIETQTDLGEARLACLAARAAGLEAAVSFTFGRNTGRTLTGSPAECCAAALEAAGAAALGLNCSPSPEDMLGLLRAMRRVSALPVVVQPNAGMPETAPDGSTFYPYSPEKMRECARALLEAGASAIGGCCGTTFDHIRALKPLTGGPVPTPAWDGQARLCSRRDCATVTEALEAVADLSDPEDAYDLEGDETAVRLDLRGLAPDEAAVRTLDASAATRLPLILRADDADALRAALLACPGRPAADAPADLRPIIDEFGAFPIARPLRAASPPKPAARFSSARASAFPAKRLSVFFIDESVRTGYTGREIQAAWGALIVTKKTSRAILFAVLAAALYALNAPVSKLLLGRVPERMMAAFLYLGAGVGMGAVKLIGRGRRERSLRRDDLPYVIGMIALDIAAPILLMLGLRRTTPETAALLNNFEIVATSLIALILFRETISRRLWLAIVLVTAASALLSVEDAGSLRFSAGSIYVLLACVCWGFENNCTRRLSDRSPLDVVIVKGLFSGAGALGIAFFAGERLPGAMDALAAMLLGFVAFGMSIFFYIRAQRDLGAARTSAYYALAPFIGAGLSLAIFRDMPGATFFLALAIMIAGAYLASSDGKPA